MILFFLCFLSWAAAQTFMTDPRVLILTTTSMGGGTDIFKNYLTSQNLPYDILAIPKEGYVGALPLEVNGQGKYNMIVFPDGLVSYDYNGQTLSALTAAQFSQLGFYEKTYRAIRILFNIYPSATYGVSLLNTAAPGCCGANVEQFYRWDANAFTNVNMIGVSLNSPMSSIGLYHYPALISNTTTNKPVLTADILSPNYGKTSVIGTSRLIDGRNMLVFFTAIGSWSVTSQNLVRYSVQWSLQKIKETTPSFVLNSRVLLIASEGSTGYQAAKVTLDGLGVPYTPLIIPSTGLAGNFTLTSGNQGLYSLIVFPEGEVVYQDSIGAYQSVITAAQWAQLAEYELKYKVRRVMMNIYPNANYYATPQNPTSPGCCNLGVERALVWEANATTLAPNAGLVSTATLSALGLYHYPAILTNTTIARPILSVLPHTTQLPRKGVIATQLSLPDGRQQLIFFISFGSFSSSSLLMNHFWIFWGMRGTFAGFRRVYLNAQIDDVFLDTSLYGTATRFRLSQTDMTQHVTWVNQLNSRLPSGSSIKLEIAYNGNGVLEAARLSPVFVPVNFLADNSFVKPLGTGTSLWPSTFSTNWNATAMLRNDLLYQYLISTAGKASYFYLTHTFSHQNLNNATYSDTYQQIANNQLFASSLYANYASHPNFSPDALVPPAISGVFNGDALRAFKDLGITNIVGDNSRPNLNNTQNIHWPLTSRMAGYGFDGMLILPRFPTEIYVNASNPADNTALFNTMYSSQLGVLTFNDIMTREAKRVLPHLLSVRKDGHQFHQANMRVSGLSSITLPNGRTGVFSLVMAWIESVVSEYLSVVNWPIISLKQSDMARLFVARQTRDQAEYTVQTVVNSNSAITGFIVTAKNACVVPITSPVTAIVGNGVSVERIGNDPFTIWVTLAAGQTRTVTLTTPIPWN